MSSLQFVTQPVIRAFNPTVLTLLLIVVVGIRSLLARPSLKRHSPWEWKLYDWPVFGSALQFYTKRRDMLIQGAHLSHNGNFSFYVGKKHVIGLSGLTGRKTFYETRELNFAAGFNELLADVPSLGQPAEEERWIRQFHRTLLAVTRREDLARKLACWSKDIRSMCNDLGTRPAERESEWRLLNPFQDVYELVYKLTTRLVASTELAENPEHLRWSLSIFERLEGSNSITRFIFRWLITPTIVIRIVLGVRLYLGLLGMVKARKNGENRQEDALQYLLDQGSSAADVVKFQITALWAGFITTGAIGCWMPILLASNPEWKLKCSQEINDVIRKYRNSSWQSPTDVLDSLDIGAWESDFPILHCCLRETIRLCLTGTVFRKNTSGDDVKIGDTGDIIPNGSFGAYVLDDVHMDPKIYPDPLSFRPERFLNCSSTQKAETSHSYVGWGSGRHPCWIKVATLEITMIVAYFMVAFEFELSNQEAASVVEHPPIPDRNRHKAEKENRPIFVRYKTRVL